MIITIDTTAPLSDQDKAILTPLLHPNPGTYSPVVNVQGDPDLDSLRARLAGGTKEDYVSEEKPAPRRRAAAKKAPEPVAEEAPEEPVDETPEAVEDDTPAVLEEEPAATDDAPTLEDAVAAATPLISAGKASVVKAALANAGVKRVGELPAEKIAGFISELNEEA